MPAVQIGVEKSPHKAAILQGSLYQYPPKKCFAGFSGIPATTKKMKTPDSKDKMSQLFFLYLLSNKAIPQSSRMTIWIWGVSVARDHVPIAFRQSIELYKGGQ